ncbi:MAG TPA: glycosyltransferase [Thermoanaerobaculaceae bacterium]|nr:glycosyltransferase [Thermoanaerobaculaceae bacterium]
MGEPYLSVVVPVFNEEANLPNLLARLTAALAGVGRPYEVVLVNDGSSDGSLVLLREAAGRDPHLVVIDFNRNYGQHAAVFAGFEAARGEVIVTIDADLQNPPEEIPKLVAKMEEGFDVVGSVRVQRKDTFFRRAASRLVNKVTSMATGVHLSDYGCMLRAYRRDVVRTLCSSKEISTFIPVLADMFAGHVTEVPVAHAERMAGKSKYSFWKLLRLQFDLMTSFSLWPLRAMLAIGVLTAMASMAVAAVLIAGRLIKGHEWAVSGVFTLFAVMFFFVGVLFFALGLLGEYVGRIYLEVRHRPRYVVRQIFRTEAGSGVRGPGSGNGERSDVDPVGAPGRDV